MMLRPFKSIMPRRDLVHIVSSPPYDILEYEDVERILRKNPLSFLRITRSEVELGMKDNPYDGKVYAKARENFERFIKDGVLLRNDEEKMFIYSLRFRGKVQIGIVATFSVDEYDLGKMKKHELTREDKELDRVKHILTVGAHTGPVYLFYRSIKDVKDILREILSKSDPIFSFEADGVLNEVHVIDDENAGKLVNIFEGIDSFYIADGHHRASGASKVRRMMMEKNPNHTGEEEYNYFLGVLFPHDELNVLPYNRLMRCDLDPDEMLSNLKSEFEIESIDGFEEPGKGEFVVTYRWERWWRMKLKDKFTEFEDENPVETLDTFILQERVLKRIFGVENPRKDERLRFIGGLDHLERMERFVKEDGYDYGFFLHPTSVEEIMKVSDAGRIMPPKSTWFEPKLRSGIFIHPI